TEGGRPRGVSRRPVRRRSAPPRRRGGPRARCAAPGAGGPARPVGRGRPSPRVGGAGRPGAFLLLLGRGMRGSRWERADVPAGGVRSSRDRRVVAPKLGGAGVAPHRRGARVAPTSPRRRSRPRGPHAGGPLPACGPPPGRASG